MEIRYYMSDLDPTGTVIDAWNVSFSKSVADVGQSGISVSELTFDTAAANFSAPSGGRITCDEIPGNDFYVDSRTRNGSVMSVSCLDGAALLDREIDLAEPLNRDSKGNKYLTSTALIDRCRADCGVAVAVPWNPTAYGFPVAVCEGKSYQALLTEISEAQCGFYSMMNGTLTLRYLNEQGGVTTRSCSDHSYVNISGEFEYQAIDVINSYGTSTVGSPTAATYNTLTISDSLCDYIFPTYDAYNPEKGTYTYVDTSTVPAALDNIIGKSFTGWQCDNAVLTSIPDIGDYIAFAQESGAGTQRVTSVSVRFLGSTKLMSLSGGLPSGGELCRRSRRQAEIDSKVPYGKPNGNVLNTPHQGNIYLEESGNTQS